MNLVTPDSGLIIWMTLIFAIVFFILAKFGFPVITGLVDKRQERIESSLRDAEEARKQLEQMQQLKEQIIDQAHSEQTQILQEAAGQREAILAKAREDASRQTEELLKEARERIATEQEDAMRQVRAQVAMLSVSVAEKVLRENLKDGSAQSSYIDSLVEEVSNSQTSKQS